MISTSLFWPAIPQMVPSILTTRSFRLKFIFAILWVGLFLPSASFGGSIIQSARAAGMGVAFIATADDPSAVAFNPAGLTQLKGTQYYGGMSALYPQTEYTRPEGDSEETKSSFFFPPHAYLTTDFGLDDFGFGVGIYSPFGIGGRRWSERGPLRYLSTESSIATVDISVAAAWAVIPDRLSIGGSLLCMISNNAMAQMIDQSAFRAPDAKISYDGWGWGLGFTLGVLAEPVDNFRIGLYYRSQVEVTHKGDVRLERIAPALQPVYGGFKYKTSAETTQDLPRLVGIGLAYQPLDRLTLEVDYQWLQWSSFKKATLDLKYEVPAGGLTDVTTELDWKDAYVLSLGAEYRLSERWTLRGGYFYTQNQIPNATVNPAAPDADSHTFTAGAGWQFGKFTTDFYFAYAIYQTRSVDNAMVAGEFDNGMTAAGMSVKYLF